MMAKATVNILIGTPLLVRNTRTNVVMAQVRNAGSRAVRQSGRIAVLSALGVAVNVVVLADVTNNALVGERATLTAQIHGHGGLL